MFADKLKKGDLVRIVAPSHSFTTLSKIDIKKATNELEKLGLKVSFGANIDELDEFNSSSVGSRVSDINEAFRDKEVKLILAARGGFNSNQLLKYLDYNLIKKNPKLFCGYSDITALNMGIYAKTNLVTYAGLNFSTFRKPEIKNYNIDYFKKCLLSNKPYNVFPSKTFMEYKNKIPKKNPGFLVINEGETKGKIIGENLCTMNILQGTEFMPSIKNSVLFIEEENISEKNTLFMFDRELQSILQLPDFDKVKGIVIGRFQSITGLNNSRLIKLIKTKKELEDISIIANLDFAHTIPRFTFPIGGEVELIADRDNPQLKITKH